MSAIAARIRAALIDHDSGNGRLRPAVPPGILADFEERLRNLRGDPDVSERPSPISDLKITGVEAIYLRLPEVKEQCDSGQDALIVKVTTDAGIVGYGEVDSSPLAAKGAIEGPFSHTATTGLGQVLDRRGPVPDRVPLAEDVPGEHLQRSSRDRHPRHERDRPGTLGHQGQGARDAGLEAARRRVRKVAPTVRQLPLRRDPGGDRRAGPAVRRSGVHGGQVRLGPDGPGRARPTSRWSARPERGLGPDIDLMIDAGLVYDAKTAIQRARAFEEYDLFWFEEPLAARRLRGLRQALGRLDLADRRRRGGERAEVVPPTHGRRARSTWSRWT